jgi:hypothetical protein
VLDGDVSGARLEPREKRGKATRWDEPVHGGDGKEQDAKKSGDQRQGSFHGADLVMIFKLNLSVPLGFGRVEILQSPWVGNSTNWAARVLKKTGR